MCLPLTRKLTIVFLVFTYQFDFWNEVSDRWKGDVPWLKMSFGKTAAYGECCERPILKKISAVSVPPRVPILLHTDHQRTDSSFFFSLSVIFEVVHIVHEEFGCELGEELKNGASNFESPSLIF